MLAHLYDIIAPRFEMADWPGQNWLIRAALNSAVALLSVVNLFAAQTGLLEIALSAHCSIR